MREWWMCERAVDALDERLRSGAQNGTKRKEKEEKRNKKKKNKRKKKKGKKKNQPDEPQGPMQRDAILFLASSILLLTLTVVRCIRVAQAAW